MRIKFQNSEVEVWKLRRGTLIDCPSGLTYITDIGSVDKIDGEFIAHLFVENMDLADTFYSDELVWLEP